MNLLDGILETAGPLRNSMVASALALAVLAIGGSMSGAGRGTAARQATGRLRPVISDGMHRVAHLASRVHTANGGVALLPAVNISPEERPLALVDDDELWALYRDAPDELGSAAIGAPNRGKLVGGRRFESGPGWKVVDAERAWGTRETVQFLERALRSFARESPRGDVIFVGDLSRRSGGPLRPHRSHQTGRDVDVGYAYVDGAFWYRHVTRENFDAARTWRLLLCLMREGDVEYVFMDAFVQELLREHALAQGFSEEWLDTLLGAYRSRSQSVVRHTWGHRTHMHVRFFADESEATGSRVAKLVVARGRRRR